MADALEQTKDLFSVDDFNEDDISDKSKLISALENPFGEFRPKEEIIEKAKATGTGLLTGTLGIPSDAATLASAVSSGMAKYADSPTAMMLKDVLEKAKDDVGRPAFDKWFTKTTGLESNPENVDQLVGEVLSPTGALLAPAKTLKNIFAPLKKGVTDFFDKMPPPDSGLAVETAGVGQLDQTKKILQDKQNNIKTNIPETAKIKINNIDDISKSVKKLETTPVKKSPALQKISEITKLRDGQLGSRTPMDKDGLPKNLIRDKGGKPLVLYYGDSGVEYLGNFPTTKKNINEYSDIIDQSVRLDNPDSYKNIFHQDKEFAKGYGGELKSGSLKYGSDDFPSSLTDKELEDAQNEIKNLTQEYLKDLPEEITVYRYGDLDNDSGVSSFTLNPNYNVDLSLPWQKRLQNPMQTFKVKKKDILASPDINSFFSGGRKFDEQEIIINNDKVTQIPNPIGLPAKLKNKFEPSGRVYSTGTGNRPIGNFVTPNPVFASRYAGEKGSVIPVYLIADKVNNIKARSFIDIDKASADAKKGEVYIGDVGFDVPPFSFYSKDEKFIKNAVKERDESIKKYGTEQYAFNRGTQVFSAITGERLTELPTINQNIRNKLLKLTQKEEDIVLKNMSPEKRIKYKAEKTYTEDFTDDPDFVEDMFKLDRKGDIELNEQKRNLAKGGDMKKQMEMFEEGGLKQEGGTIDPVSGNDVPPGSTQEEVRDDIPAQLSEGEFVFPADVVRYIGLEKLMRLRQEAKQGLKMMEEMGQMGNSEEATMPDDLPFDETDLDMEDEEEYNNDTQEMNQGGMVRVGGMEMPRPRIAGQQMAEGGVVKAQTGTFVTPGTGVTTTPSQFAGQNLPSYKPTETIESGTRPSYVVPTIPASQGGYDPKFMTSTQQTQIAPSFETLVGKTPGQYDEMRTYKNDAGATLQIPFKNGQPIYPIPEGYTFVDPEEEQTQAPTLQTTQTKTTTTTGDGGDDTGARVGTTMVGKTGKSLSALSPQEIQKSFSNMSTSQRGLTVMDALDKAKGQTGLARGLQQLGTVAVPGALAAGMIGQKTLDPREVLSQVGKPNTTALNSILNTFGPSTKGLSPEEIDMQGIDRNEALSQAVYGMSLDKATSFYGATPSFTKGYKNGDMDPTTGATYSHGQAGDPFGVPSYASIEDFGKAMQASMDTGFFGSLATAKAIAMDPNKTAKQKEKAIAFGKKVDPFFNMEIDTRTDAEVEADLDDISQDPDVQGKAEAEKGFNVEETFGSGEAPSSTGPGTSMGAADMGLGDISTDNDNSSDSSDSSSESQGDSSEHGGTYKGSLITKRKASGKLKKKYMKRGGLASKK